MTIKAIAAQLRTTDLPATLRFYIETLGFTIDFNYEDFYAGIRAGEQTFHLKQIDEKDPSIAFVDQGGHLHLYFEVKDVAAFAEDLKGRGVTMVQDIHETDWNTREFVIHDDQGHTLYFGEAL